DGDRRRQLRPSLLSGMCLPSGEGDAFRLICARPVLVKYLILCEEKKPAVAVVLNLDGFFREAYAPAAATRSTDCFDGASAIRGTPMTTRTAMPPRVGRLFAVRNACSAVTVS